MRNLEIVFEGVERLLVGIGLKGEPSKLEKRPEMGANAQARNTQIDTVCPPLPVGGPISSNCVNPCLRRASHKNPQAVQLRLTACCSFDERIRASISL